MEAIFTQTDDGIFFSTKLCDDLIEHGDQLAASFKKRFGKGSPRITKPDFSKARDDDLMPSDGNYADWVNMFVKRTDRPSHGAYVGESSCKKPKHSIGNSFFCEEIRCKKPFLKDAANQSSTPRTGHRTRSKAVPEKSESVRDLPNRLNHDLACWLERRPAWMAKPLFAGFT